MTIGTVWGDDTWGADTWGADTWGDAIIPLVTDPLEFTSIKIEAYISAAWVDISADVLQNPQPSWNMGIMGNSPVDRVGDSEIFTFSMRYGEDNSAGLVGY